MAELFATSKQTISYQIINIMKDKELNKMSVVKEYLTTAADGKNYNGATHGAWHAVRFPRWNYVFFSSVQKNLPFGAEISRPHSRWISIAIHYTGELVSGVY